MNPQFFRGDEKHNRGWGWRARIRTWNKGSKDPCDTISPPAKGKYRSGRRNDAGMVSDFTDEVYQPILLVLSVHIRCGIAPSPPGRCLAGRELGDSLEAQRV